MRSTTVAGVISRVVDDRLTRCEGGCETVTFHPSRIGYFSRRITKVAEFVKTTLCTTVDDFLNALSRRGNAFRSFLPGRWIFRGHEDDETYELLPSALRDGSQQVVDLSLFPIVNNKDQRYGEIRVLADFFERSDAIGLNLPEDTQALRRFFDEARHSEADIWPRDEVLSLMALARHHGLPARLLDWSRHPLKAALFAGHRAARNSDQLGSLSVWAFSLDMLELTKGMATESLEPPPFTVITAPSASNSNLHAQEGVFTLGQRIIDYDTPIDRTPFDELLSAWAERNRVTSTQPWFHRITLPRSEAKQLCYELAYEGITQATLFPNFYGVVRTMTDMSHWYSPGGPGRQ
jgi:hypothetical protein